MRNDAWHLLVYTTLAGVLLASPAFAYGGPGAGISAIGTLLSIIASLFLAIIGFVWYPVKRILRKFRKSSPPDGKVTPQDPK